MFGFYRFMDGAHEDYMAKRRRSFEVKKTQQRGRRSYLPAQDTTLRSCFTAPQLNQGPAGQTLTTSLHSLYSQQSDPDYITTLTIQSTVRPLTTLLHSLHSQQSDTDYITAHTTQSTVRPLTTSLHCQQSDPDCITALTIQSTVRP